VFIHGATCFLHFAFYFIVHKCRNVYFGEKKLSSLEVIHIIYVFFLQICLLLLLKLCLILEILTVI